MQAISYFRNLFLRIALLLAVVSFAGTTSYEDKPTHHPFELLLEQHATKKGMAIYAELIAATIQNNFFSCFTSYRLLVHQRYFHISAASRFKSQYREHININEPIIAKLIRLIHLHSIEHLNSFPKG